MPAASTSSARRSTGSPRRRRRRLDEVATLAGIWLDDPAFPARAHLGAVGLELAREQEEAVLRWARWARDAGRPVARTDDPGPWDPTEVFTRLADPQVRTALTRLLTAESRRDTGG